MPVVRNARLLAAYRKEDPVALQLKVIHTALAYCSVWCGQTRTVS